MKEVLELRLDTELVAEHVPDLGEPISESVTRILVDANGPDMTRLVDLARRLEMQGTPLLAYWHVHRTYERGELEACELLQIEVTARTQSAGRFHGTTYDARIECPDCKYGLRQTSDLHFAESKLRTGKDAINTLTNEILVSERFATALRSIGATGCRFAPIRRSRPRGQLIEDWYQLVVESAPVDLGPSTVAGVDPFDPDVDGEYTCRDHDWIGLNQVSHATVTRESWDGSDVCATRQRVGSVLGVLEPHPLLLFSNRAWRALTKERMRGFRFDRVDFEPMDPRTAATTR